MVMYSGSCRRGTWELGLECEMGKNMTAAFHLMVSPEKCFQLDVVLSSGLSLMIREKGRT